MHWGDFDHPDKFVVWPLELPAQLHWFYWESYSAWRLGFALFTVFWLRNADTYSVGKSLMNWSLPLQLAAQRAPHLEPPEQLAGVDVDVDDLGRGGNSLVFQAAPGLLAGL